MRVFFSVMIVAGLTTIAVGCGSGSGTPDDFDAVTNDSGSDAGEDSVLNDSATQSDTADAEPDNGDTGPAARQSPLEWGPFAIGYRVFDLTDADRDERPVPVIVYYPATGTPVSEGTVTPCSSETADLAAMAAQPDALTADIPDGGFPVFVYSHGSGARKEEYKYLLEFVASHGFVAVAMDHTGNTGFENFMPSDIEMTSLRVQDVLFTIDWLRSAAEEPASPMKGLVDMANVAVSGHSYGGHIAMAIGGAAWDFQHIAEQCSMEEPPDPYVCSLADHRQEWDDRLPAPGIKAMISMAHDASDVHFGTGCAGAAAIEVPSMYLGGTADTVAVFDTNAGACFAADDAPSYLVKITDGGHIGFTDMFSDSTMSCERTHFIVRGMTAAFLKRWLKSETGMDTFIDSQAAGWPDSTDFETVTETATVF